MDAIRRANRHGWVCIGVYLLGNCAYSQLCRIDRSGRRYYIAIQPTTGRVFPVTDQVS